MPVVVSVDKSLAASREGLETASTEGKTENVILPLASAYVNKNGLHAHTLT